MHTRVHLNAVSIVKYLVLIALVALAWRIWLDYQDKKALKQHEEVKARQEQQRRSEKRQSRRQAQLEQKRLAQVELEQQNEKRRQQSQKRADLIHQREQERTLERRRIELERAKEAKQRDKERREEHMRQLKAIREQQIAELTIRYEQLRAEASELTAAHEKAQKHHRLLSAQVRATEADYKRAAAKRTQLFQLRYASRGVLRHNHSAEVKAYDRHMATLQEKQTRLQEKASRAKCEEIDLQQKLKRIKQRMSFVARDLQKHGAELPATSTTPAPQPLPVYVLVTGQRLTAKLCFDEGDSYVIRDPAGDTHTVKKADVQEILR